MPEKKNSGFKEFVEKQVVEYAKESIYSFLSMLKKRLKQYAVSMMLVIASFTVIIYGIGSLVGYFFPAWPSGISHIIVGVLFLLAARAYIKR